MLTQTDAGTVITREIEALIAEDHDETIVLTGEESFGNLGINSLTLARLLIALEAVTGVDPFGSGDLAISDVRSVNELIAAYQNAGTAAPARQS